MTYLRHAIPVLGRMLRGDPKPYRMLAEYTSRFGDSRAIARSLRAAGMEVELTSACFGCATGVRGHRPVRAEGYPLDAGSSSTRPAAPARMIVSNSSPATRV